MDLDVVPNEAIARVCGVAADYARWENAAMGGHVVEFDVLQRDEGLGCTSCIATGEWVDHAARATATGLP